MGYRLWGDRAGSSWLVCRVIEWLIQFRGQTACHCEKGADNCEGYGNVAKFSGTYLFQCLVDPYWYRMTSVRRSTLAAFTRVRLISEGCGSVSDLTGRDFLVLVLFMFVEKVVLRCHSFVGARICWRIWTCGGRRTCGKILEGRYWCDGQWGDQDALLVFHFYISHYCYFNFVILKNTLSYLSLWLEHRMLLDEAKFEDILRAEWLEFERRDCVYSGGVRWGRNAWDG